MFDTWYLGGTRNHPFSNCLIDWLINGYDNEPSPEFLSNTRSGH